MNEQPDPVKVARMELAQAIGLAQAQFADSRPGAPGFDSAALLAAVDAFEAAVRLDERTLVTLAAVGAFAAVQEQES